MHPPWVALPATSHHPCANPTAHHPPMTQVMATVLGGDPLQGANEQ